MMIKDRFVTVSLGGQNITIDYGGEKEKINWTEVEKITQLKLVTPPLYKLKIKNNEHTYIFVSQPYSISLGFGTIDTSDMGAFIKKKKRELRI